MTNILIVDDKPDSLELLGQFLISNGFNPLPAANGKLALGLLEKNHVELIISDILMPEVDGYMLCKKVKSEARWRNIPFIFYSATFTSEQDEAFAIKLGATKFIRKPAELNAFLQIIREVLQNRLEGKLNVAQLKFKEEKDVFRYYNERIVRKLEEKVTELEESEKRFRTLFENASEGILCVEIESQKIKYINPAFCHLLGYSERESLQLTARDIFPLSAHPLINREYEMLANRRKSMVQDIPCLRRDGSILYANFSLSRIIIDGLNCAVGFMTDTTETKKVNDALRRSEERLATAAQIAKLGYWNYDVAADLFTFDDHFYAIFHTTAAQVGGYTMKPERYARQFLYPEDQPLVAQEMSFALSTNDPHFTRRVEHRILYADGGIGWISVNYFVVKDAEGRTIQTYGVNQDITDLKAAEAQRDKSEQYFRSVWENSLDGMCLSDKKGIILMVNQAFCQIVEIAKEALIGQPFTVIYQDDHGIESLTSYVKKFKAGTMPKHFEKEMVLWNSKKVWLSVTHSYLETEPGSRALLTVFRNITDEKQKQVEEELLRSQLMQSQKIEAIGNLAGGIAHDFNNLLTVIQGHTQIMMLHSTENDPHYHDLKQVMNASTKAANLTRQLLLFSRKQAMEFKPINLNETVENMLKMIKRLIGETVKVETVLVKNAWNVEADEGNIEQVIINLIINSRDAMPAGGTVTIRTENIELSESDSLTIHHGKPGRYLRLSIEDTGQGIPAELLGKIFDPFFTTKEAGKGTGLGLSVVYGIVKKHKGWINVYSEVGRGTIFKIYLPITDKAVAEKNEPPKNIMPHKGQGERILIVEDNLEVLKFTCSILNQSGYVVLTASTAAQALAEFHKAHQKIDLLVSDVVLPDNNGALLADEILTHQPRLPVILCSGYAEDTIIKSIKANPQFHFIQKPYQAHALLELIYQLLHQPS